MSCSVFKVKNTGASVDKTGLLSTRFFVCAWLFIGFFGCLMPGYAANDHLIIDTPATPALQRVRTLIRANVLDLAERILEQQGPTLAPNGEWLNWERQLWTLYRASGDWQKLYDRLRTIPPAFPSSVIAEAQSQSVEALIALGDGAAARRILRRQLVSADFSERGKRKLRLQIIESYLSDDMLSEANRGAGRFQQDFRPQDKDWLMLASRIALLSDSPDTAVNLLAPLTEPDARLLRLWARSKNRSIAPEQLLETGSVLRAEEEFQAWRAPLFSMMSDAAATARDRVQQADLMEQYFLDVSRETYESRNTVLSRVIPNITPEGLLDTYQSIAIEQANKTGLLVGEESSWGLYAGGVSSEQDVVKRAVWAHIVKSTDTVARQVASDNLINSLVDSERMDLIQVLYGNSLPLGELNLSPATALRLSNLALEAGKVELAAQANENVSNPPPGMAYEDWLAYTGRISIIAGRHEQGAQQLHRWIDSVSQLTEEQTDKILQPIFDLQTVEQHTLAIPLLEKVNEKSPGGKYIREIAFWVAESYGATNQHIKAADYFLFSAMQRDNGFDQWGRSARFRAADALLQGNFFEDALRLFEGLLSRAEEDSQKQSLQQKIQQIWLRRSSVGNTE